MVFFTTSLLLFGHPRNKEVEEIWD
jgi:hypothetical protein